MIQSGFQLLDPSLVLMGMRGAMPLLSRGLNVTPYPKPFTQWFQSPPPSQPSRFPTCSGEEWIICIQRASAVLSSSRRTHQVPCFYVPRPGNHFPSTQYVYQRQDIFLLISGLCQGCLMCQEERRGRMHVLWYRSS